MQQKQYEEGSWQHWLSLSLSLLFLLAMGANTTLLITIWLEASLHEPMYYLLSLLSLLDMVLCLTVIPKVLAIFWFDLRLRYCAENIIKNCICTNLSVPKLSCDDISFNQLYQFVVGWTTLGSDFILIVLSYSFILKAVLRIKAKGAVAKALSTCGSRFILILFFSTVLLVLVITNKRILPDVPILLNILHHLIPPALNPIVYGVRTKEIKQGIQKLL
nr:PREDICTED: olfactory receptor 56A4-like [Equus przewalskii]